MNYLITGGGGFIGAFVVRRLLEQGHQVVIYDIAPNPTFMGQVVGEEKLKAVTFVRGDIMDLAHLARSLKQSGAQALIHLAYVLGVDTELNPTRGVRINCEGTNNAFEAAYLAGIKRVVWASSIAVFGPKSAGAAGVVANDAPYDPINIYGACKALNELVARRFARSYKLEPIGLRFPLVYGPGAVRGWAGFLTALVENLIQGRPAQVPPGNLEANWCFVDDIAAGIVGAAAAPPARIPAFTLPGEVRTVGEAVACALSFFPRAKVEINERFTPLELANRLDGGPAREHLSWQPRYRLEEGVREMVTFYRQVHGQGPV